MASRRSLGVCCLGAIAVAVVALIPIRAALGQSVDAATKGVAALPAMKGIALSDVKASGKHFTAKLGSKKLPAILFATGPAKKPVWNVAVYPKSLGLNKLYARKDTRALGAISVIDPAIVISGPTTKSKLTALPKRVQEGIKKVFAKLGKEVTYPAGVNFSFKLDLAKSPGLAGLNKPLAVYPTAAMAGTVGADLIRHLANGKAATTKADTAAVALTAVYNGIITKEALDSFSTGQVVVTFKGDKKGRIQLAGRTRVTVTLGEGKEKTKYVFDAALRFDAKAKSADKKMVIITGPLTPVLKKPIEFGAFAAASLSLDAAVMGNRRLVVAFKGVTDKKKPFAVNALLAQKRGSDTLELEETFPDNPTVHDIIGYSRPGLDKIPFKKLKMVGDVVTGTVKLTGHDMQAFAFKVDEEADERHLAVVPKKFHIGAWLPGVKGSLLLGAQFPAAVLMVVPDGAGDDTPLKELPKLVADRIVKVIGSDTVRDHKNKLPIADGLNFFLKLDVSKSAALKTVMGGIGIKEKAFGLVGSVSPVVFSTLPDKVAAQAKEDDDAVADTLKSFRLTTTVPAPSIPGVEKVFDFDDGWLRFGVAEADPYRERKKKDTKKSDDDGEDDEDMEDDAIAVVIENTVKVKLPGKTIPMTAELDLQKGLNKKAHKVTITGTSGVDWNRAFGLPFLNLQDIGVSAAFEVNKKGEHAFAPALTAGIKLGSTKVEASEEDDDIEAGIELTIEPSGITDIALSVDGRIDLDKLPGLGKVPGIKDFAIEDYTVSLAAIHGKLIWKTLDYKAAVAVVEMQPNKYAAFVRVHDLNLETLFGKLRKPLDLLQHLTFPRAVLAFSTIDLAHMEVGDLPDAAADMFEDIVDDGNDVPVYAGATLIGALGEKDFSDDLHEIIAKELKIYDHIESDLVVAGAINGIFGGNPKIGLYADLPGYKFPKDQPWARAVSLDKAKANFFIRGDMAGTIVNVGVGGAMEVTVPHLADPKESDTLAFVGEAYVSADLVSLAGSAKVAGRIDGKWREPFGLKNVTYENPSVLIGADSEGSVEFGIGTTMEFAARNKQKLRFAGDFLVNINFSTTIPLPKKLGFRLQAKKLSDIGRLEVADAAYRGVLTGPMAKAIIGDLKDKKAREFAEYLRDHLEKRSLLDILRVDDWPLTYIELQDVDIYFATPGATIPGREDTLEGMGFVSAGKTFISLMGKKTQLSEVDNRLTLQDGLRIHAKFPSRHLGPIKLHKAVIDATANIHSIPKFYLRGDATLFGARQALDIELSKDRLGFGALLNLGPLLQVDMDAATLGKDLFRAKAFEAKIKGAAIAGLAFTETTARFDGRSGLEFTSSSEIPIGLPLPPVGTLGKANATAEVKVNDATGHRLYDIAFATETLGFGGAVGFRFEGTPRSIDVAYGARDKDGASRHPCIPFSGNTHLSQGDLAAFGKRAAQGALPPEAFRELVNFNADIELPSLSGAKDCGSRVLGLAKDIADKARKAAEKLAMEAAEATKKAAELAARKSREAAEKAAKLAAAEARKAAELAAREVKKASERAAKEAREAAEKAAKATRIAAEKAANAAREEAERATNAAHREIERATQESLSAANGAGRTVFKFAGDGIGFGRKVVSEVGNAIKDAFCEAFGCGRSPEKWNRNFKMMLLQVPRRDSSEVCFDIRKGDNSDDNEVIWSECHGDWNQAWRLLEDGRIQNVRGKCIGFHHSYVKGHEVVIYGCDHRFVLHAIIDKDGQIRLRDKHGKGDYCINTNGDDDAVLWDCKPEGDSDAGIVVWYDPESENIVSPGKEWIKTVGLSREFFDPEYYFEHHKDVVNHGSFGPKHSGLARHWILEGMREGRRGNARFDVRAYRERNKELDASFGDNWTAYYRHWDEWGRKQFAEGIERRNPHPEGWKPPAMALRGRDASAFVDRNIVNLRNLCADEESGQRTQGGTVVVGGCRPGDRQRWSHNARGQIVTTNDLCLDVASGTAKHGEALNIWACRGGGAGLERQRWRMAEAGRIQHIDSGLCLDATNNGNGGGRLVVANCAAEATQFWATKPPPGLAGSIFAGSRLRNARGLCADEESGKLTRGGPVITWGCGDFEGQNWTHNARAQIVTNNNLCLDVASGTARPGEAMIIWTCQSGGAILERQQWGRSPDGRLHHMQSGLCLDATNNGNRRGRLVLSHCGPTDTQVWTPIKAVQPALALAGRDKSAFSNMVLGNVNNLCADEFSGNLKRGGRVVVRDCNALASRPTTHNTYGHIAVGNNLCLDIAGGKAIAGAWINIWNCEWGGAGLRRQQWRIADAGRVQHKASGLCLDAQDGGKTGGQLVLARCGTALTQYWVAKRAPAVTASAFLNSRLSNLQGMCVDEASGKLTRGGKVIVWPCGDLMRQVWSHNGRGQIVSSNNLCLDIAGAKAVNGAWINIWTCLNSGAHLQRQRWSRTADGRLHHVQSGFCLDAQNNGNQGGQMVLSTCRPEDTQVWKPVAAMRTASAFQTKSLINAQNLCADEGSGRLTRGGKVIMWGCNNSTRQKWTHNDRGQIVTSNNLCLDLASGKARKGEEIIIWSCNARGAAMERQRWALTSGGRLQHLASGYCLDATNNGNARGRLVLSSCGQQATQLWAAR